MTGKKLAEDDLTSTHWQRGLWVSYWRLSDLAERRKNAGEAKGYWSRPLTCSRTSKSEV